jgi:hypothetical protein
LKGIFMAMTKEEIQEQKDLEAMSRRDARAEAEAAKPPKPLTIPESLQGLKGQIQSLRVMVARGSKSDLDQIGARLSELEAWIDAVLDDKRDNPRSVAHVYQPDPVPVQPQPVRKDNA